MCKMFLIYPRLILNESLFVNLVKDTAGYSLRIRGKGSDSVCRSFTDEKSPLVSLANNRGNENRNCILHLPPANIDQSHHMRIAFL